MTASEMRICAPVFQRDWRDLAHLEALADRVDWLASEDLVASAYPAVLCGLEADRSPEDFSTLVRKRAMAGFSTIVAPRFKAGDWTRVLGAPVPVHIKSGEAGRVLWEDGDAWDLPVFAVIETAMAATRWGATEKGCCIMAWRSSTANGPVILCTAGIAGPALGVDLEAQHGLLSKIVKHAVALQPAAVNNVPPAEVEPFVDPDRFLAASGGDAAAVLLTLYAAYGKPDVDPAFLAEHRLGMRLSSELLPWLDRFSHESRDAIAAALIRYGWRAHLRQVDVLQREDDPL